MAFFYGRENILAVLSHYNDVGSIGREAVVSSCRGICIGEFHHTKVAQVLRVVFDDPLGIPPTKCDVFRLEHMLYLLLCGQVLDLGCTTIARSRGDCEPDLVTSIYGKTVEENRIFWIPLIPS